MLVSGCATLSPGTYNRSAISADKAFTGMTTPAETPPLQALSDEEFETFIAGRKSGYQTCFTEAPGPPVRTTAPPEPRPAPAPVLHTGDDDSDGWIILAGASRIVLTGLLGPGIAFVIAGEILAAGVYGIASLFTGN